MIAFCSPFLSHRRYLRGNADPCLRIAPQEASTRAANRNLLPRWIWLLRLFPADRLLPGQILDHLHSLSAVANWLISAPISARILAATCSLIPGIVCSNSYCLRYGASCSSIFFSSASTC